MIVSKAFSGSKGYLLLKMHRQDHIFARQVQVDLLALTDVDLFQAVHGWVNGEASEPPYEAPEEARLALGYTRSEDELPTLSPDSLSSSAGVVGWLAPAPQQLRELLVAMDVKSFVQYVLPLAFQALHMSHPEWSEGATFNAHLANHLRWISKLQRGTARVPLTPQRGLPLS